MSNPGIPPRLEFRVRKVTRYIVTGYSRYDGDPDDAHIQPGRGNWTICEASNLDYANEIAETYGAQNPGCLVCTMAHEPEYAAEFKLTREQLERAETRLREAGIDGMLDLIVAHDAEDIPREQV